MGVKDQLQDIHSMVYVIAQDVSAIKNEQANQNVRLANHANRIKESETCIRGHEQILQTGKYACYAAGSVIGIWSTFGDKIAEFLHLHFKK